MSYALQNKFNFFKRLKVICIGNTAVEILMVPLTIIIARLLSNLMLYAVDGSVSHVIKMAVWFVILLIILTVSRTIVDIYLRRLSARLSNRCRLDFLETVLRNPLDCLYKADHGELVENLNDDLNTCVNCYTKLYPDLISNSIALLGYSIYLAMQNIVVFLSLLVFSLLQLVPPLIVKKFMQINYNKCRELEAGITDHIVEAVNGFETIKLYNLKQWWIEKMIAYYKRYLSVGHKVDAIAAAQRSMYRLIDNILRFGSYALLGIYIMVNWCSMEVAVEAIYLSGNLFAAIKMLFSNIPDFAVLNVAKNRIDKWVPQTSQDDNSYLSEISSIVLKNVHFDYGKKEIFDGVNVKFYADKSYMIEGVNGTGKTTLLHMIIGIVKPSDGEIIIENLKQNIRNFDINDINPQSMLYIPQNDPEFSFDAATLFAMFNKEVKKRLFQIAGQFGLTDNNLYGCNIKELSGGERKKVFLSIGFAICPQWLLLDEPSNNLDAHGIDVLQELIASRGGIIVISHNTDLRKSVDQIMKVENGYVQIEK